MICYQSWNICSAPDWEPVDGELDWVSSGSGGEVWGVLDSKVVRREGVTAETPGGTVWGRVGGSLVHVVTCGKYVWGITTDNKTVYHETPGTDDKDNDDM